jgi:hypothetical protein
MTFAIGITSVCNQIMAFNSTYAKEYWENSDAQFTTGVSGARKRQTSEKMNSMKSNSFPPKKKRRNSPKVSKNNNAPTPKPTYADVVKGTSSPALVTKAVVVFAPKIKLAQKTVQAVNDVTFNYNTSVKNAAPVPSAKVSKSTSTTAAVPGISTIVATTSTFAA